VKKILFIFVFYFLVFMPAVSAGGDLAKPGEPAGLAAGQIQVEAVPGAKEGGEPQSALSASGNVTFDFKDADILNVLKIISYKSGVNIVTTPDVIGNVSVRLSDVPWEIALDVVLKTYGFGYQRQGNVILVTKIENVAKIAAEEPLQVEIITLKYLDAQDAQKVLIPLLSPRGKISVLYTRGQKGWQFGTFKIGKDTTSGAGLVKEAVGASKAEAVSYEKNAAGETVMKKAEFDPAVKSKMLVITDTASTLDRIRNVILPKVDIKPKQVLVETKFMEVNATKLKDLGVDWGLGTTTNAESVAVSMPTAAGSTNTAGHLLGTTAGALLTSANPYTAGGEFVFQKLTGTQFEAIIHALENDVTTNTLSAPSILTLDNQEASMLVGYHTPILESTVSAGTETTSATVTQTLDYYQEIGIRLNVVPQISEEGYINMIVHPSITSSDSHVDATSTAGGATTTSTITEYPIIDVREAQTQVLLNDGETIVIGGLLKDVKTKTRVGIPFLVNLPWIGKFFGRDHDNIEKIDLLIFITARIIREGDYSPEELAKLKKRLNQAEPVASKKEPADRQKKK